MEEFKSKYPNGIQVYHRLQAIRFAVEYLLKWVYRWAVPFPLIFSMSLIRSQPIREEQSLHFKSRDIATLTMLSPNQVLSSQLQMRRMVQLIQVLALPRLQLWLWLASHNFNWSQLIEALAHQLQSETSHLSIFLLKLACQWTQAVN